MPDLAFLAFIALVAFVQFDTLQPVAVIIGSMLASLGLIGLLLVPWLTQRVGSLNAVRVEDLQPISAFLGHRPPQAEIDDSQVPRVGS